MRGTLRGNFLRLLLAYFAGATSMLFLLVPGEISLPDLREPQRLADKVDFTRAADKVEKAGDLALFYSFKAKQLLREKITQ